MGVGKHRNWWEFRVTCKVQSKDIGEYENSKEFKLYIRSLFSYFFTHEFNLSL